MRCVLQPQYFFIRCAGILGSEGRKAYLWQNQPKFTTIVVNLVKITVFSKNMIKYASRSRVIYIVCYKYDSIKAPLKTLHAVAKSVKL